MSHHKMPLNVKVDNFLKTFNNIAASFVELEMPGDATTKKFNEVRHHISMIMTEGSKLAEMLKGESK
jgi:hypothetical protein